MSGDNIDKTAIGPFANYCDGYARPYISYAHTIMAPGYIGTALTVAPYIVMAQNAIPNGIFGLLNQMNLSQWEQSMGF